MKVIIAMIAALGVVSSFTGSAIAEVSINLRFGSSPTYRSNVYPSNVYRPTYPSHSNYQKPHYYRRQANPAFIVREVYPSSSYYGNTWNYSNSAQGRYSHDQGDRYIIEKRFIRVR
jgi:hypothetical protein